MDIREIADAGIVSLGNIYRISKVMKKAANKENITVGMLGGSITQGSLSSKPSTCYAYLVYEWWVNKFQYSEVTYVNGGIGGTTSQFGLARVERDMLSRDPDFIIIEFSVNDSATEVFKETYEGLIRKVLQAPKEPGVMILNNVSYKDGANAQLIHNEIGGAYDLTMVSIKNSLYKEVESGRIKKEDVTPDDLHPNDLGHKMVAEIVINVLEKIYDMVIGDKAENYYKIPERTVTQNRYMDSVCYHNNNMEPVLRGFIPDKSKQEGITDVFRNGWWARKSGDFIHFEVTGSMISIQYCKTIKGRAPIAKAVIDGDVEHGIILDGNFEETWGDCLYLQDLLVAGEKRKHTLDITIISADESSDIDFYLVSVIVANRERQID